MTFEDLLAMRMNLERPKQHVIISMVGPICREPGGIGPVIEVHGPPQEYDLRGIHMGLICLACDSERSEAVSDWIKAIKRAEPEYFYLWNIRGKFYYMYYLEHPGGDDRTEYPPLAQIDHYFRVCKRHFERRR